MTSGQDFVWLTSKQLGVTIKLKKNHMEKKILSFLGDTFHSTNISDKAAWEVSLE